MPQLTPPQALYSLLLLFAPCFTAPSFRYFVSFVVCLTVNLGRSTTTTVCRTSPGDWHWTDYCRFLSSYHWSVRRVSQCLLWLLLSRGAVWRDDQGRQRVCIVLDETIVEKSSKHMDGVAWQRNTHGGWCRGTHILGHYWLALCVQVRVGTRSFCCPVAWRLYRQKKRCPPEQYHTPCHLVRGLLRGLSWPQGQDPADDPVLYTVVADAGFADSKLICQCHRKGMAVIVRGRIDARVHDFYVPPQGPRGRRREWGDKLSLKALAEDASNFTQTVQLYQEKVDVQVASVLGRHRQSGLPMRFVILRMAGKQDMVIMSTDLSLTPREVAQLYADRFAIELTFRELKQHFGLGHYQVSKPKAMLRHVHLSAVACSLTQLLTLHPPQALLEAILPTMKDTPWRQYDTRSVGETQLLIRIACLLPWAFSHVAPQPRHAKNNAPLPPGAVAPFTRGLTTRRKC